MAEMTPVKSSNVAAVGYDEDARALLVEFHSGGTYAYDGADKTAYHDMLAASSPGQYFQRWVKNQYPTRKL